MYSIFGRARQASFEHFHEGGRETTINVRNGIC